MKKVQQEEGESADIVSENIQRLKELFPDAFSEGGVDFEVLRQLMGDAKVLDEGEEKYGLNWHGKKKARQIALTPSTGTLLPHPEESVDWDTTKNLFIEGDNLEVLKLLQKSYANKVKMIYIDPPYNTGKEFIYPDKFQENLNTYLKYTGQVDDEGMKFSSNTETTGRKHTNWLSMMYPRLRVARNLMAADGVILISIDDNEQANLKTICDHVFGEECFIGQLIWKSRQFTDARANSKLSVDHEYVLLYSKTSGTSIRGRERDESKYTNPDSDHRGDWMSRSILGLANKEQRPNLHYSFKDPNTGFEFSPPENTGWRYSKQRMHELIEDERILFPKNSDGRPREKKFRSELESEYTSFPAIIDDIFTSDGTKEIREHFGEQVFDFPKPSNLIKTLAEQALSGDDICLDFFSGSSATAEAILKLNVEAKTDCRFILIQLPEITDSKTTAYKLGYKTIAEIGKERIRHAAVKIRDENPDSDIDSGFKVFKLSSSNIQHWNPDRADLEESLLSHQDHLIEGRSEHDVLYELLLKRGVDLAVPIESRDLVEKTIYSIGYGVLFACLDESITKDQVEAIGQGIVDWHRELAPSSDTHVFFRDSAFSDDVSKTNMAAILEQNGITHVRSL